MSKMYESDQAAATYRNARSFPPETLALWRDAIAEMAPADRVSRVLDLGGGTGRFAGILRDIYGVPVVITDPSLSMLLRGTKEQDGFQWIASKAEHLPFAASSFDLVFMSQVFHHLENKPAAFQSIRDVLSPNGYLIIRNGTKETDATMVWPKHFPEAIEFDKDRIPATADLIRTVQDNGFSLAKHTTLFQYFAASWQEYFEKIKSRGLSALISISDQAFEAGVRSLKAWTDKQPEDEKVYEPVDIFLFKKKSG